MKSKLEKQRGITLVALVITIIVLLILAIVSIKIAIDGGLTTKAADATKQHTIGAEEEAITTGYASYQIDLANNKEATLTVKDATTEQTSEGWKVTFSGTTGNVYTINNKGEITGPTKEEKTEDDIAMEKYALGDNLQGQVMGNLISDKDNMIFKQLNGKDVTYLDMAPYVTGGETIDAAFYLKYNNKVYRVQTGFNNDDLLANTTKRVTKVYDIPENVETIKYSYDGTKDNEKDWVVLYKDETAKTAEILSPETIGTLKLGREDAEAQGSNNWEKAVYSYNHAIERLNNYASSLVTNPNKISVRSVGSNPSNPNYRNTTKYTSETIENWNCSLGSGSNVGTTKVTANGIAEKGDNNYETDLIMMKVLGVSVTKKFYWLASRYVSLDSSEVRFGVSNVSIGGSIMGSDLFYANSNGEADTSSNACAVRPVVKISLNS